MTSEQPVIGVLGGMGPLAGAQFMVRLTQLTPAGRLLLEEAHHRIADAPPAAPPDTVTPAGGGVRCAASL